PRDHKLSHRHRTEYLGPGPRSTFSFEMCRTSLCSARLRSTLSLVNLQKRKLAVQADFAGELHLPARPSTPREIVILNPIPVLSDRHFTPLPLISKTRLSHSASRYSFHFPG